MNTREDWESTDVSFVMFISEKYFFLLDANDKNLLTLDFPICDSVHCADSCQQCSLSRVKGSILAKEGCADVRHSLGVRGNKRVRVTRPTLNLLIILIFF